MHLLVILRVTGILLSLFSTAMLLPVLVAWIYGEDTTQSFAIAFAVTLGAGLAMFLASRERRELRSGDGFFITVLFYLGLGLFGAIPLYLAESVDVSFTDATFESLSGLTTTGATVLTGLDDLPRSILFYRQLLQWLGGMGIIVLAVAVLPMLGIGGMQLYRAEFTGPVKDSKLTPRITETAKALWFLYLAITVSCALAYWAAGMSLFDAICHSFSTVAIGGFSTHDASIGYFASPAVEGVAIVFMVLAGINFGLHFLVWNRRNPRLYWQDREVRLYLTMLASVAVIVSLILLQHPAASASPWRDGVFQAVSIATTTGFTTAEFSLWPSAAPILLIFAAFTGGCAGSTAGGIKVVRVLLIYLQGIREIRRLIHPSGVFTIKLGIQRVPDRVVDAVWGFFSVYVIVFLTMVSLMMLASEMDFTTAFSAVAACLNNLGPGLGDVAQHYGALGAAPKWLLIMAMVLGRLEIFTLLVLLTPAFWRR
ncbi:MAG: TrkH family potassium uptake protein [Gammaproteobacteria bacterium]|nr:TrkH family potassium uptake protein [Gammaproteobacteria bacterium]